MDKNEVFFNVLKENLLFMRHQETQRMWIANVFVAIVVGFLAYIGKTGLSSLPWYIYLALIIISLLCFLITFKLNHVFTKTQEALKARLKNQAKILGKNMNNYKAMLESEGVWKCPFLSVRWLYIILYSLSAAGFLVLCILSILFDC